MRTGAPKLTPCAERYCTHSRLPPLSLSRARTRTYTNKHTNTRTSSQLLATGGKRVQGDQWPAPQARALQRAAVSAGRPCHRGGATRQGRGVRGSERRRGAAAAGARGAGGRARGGGREGEAASRLRDAAAAAVVAPPAVAGRARARAHAHTHAASLYHTCLQQATCAASITTQYMRALAPARRTTGRSESTHVPACVCARESARVWMRT